MLWPYSRKEIKPDELVDLAALIIMNINTQILLIGRVDFYMIFSDFALNISPY